MGNDTTEPGSTGAPDDNAPKSVVADPEAIAVTPEPETAITEHEEPAVVPAPEAAAVGMAEPEPTTSPSEPVAAAGAPEPETTVGSPKPEAAAVPAPATTEPDAATIQAQPAAATVAPQPEAEPKSDGRMTTPPPLRDLKPSSAEQMGISVPPQSNGGGDRGGDGDSANPGGAGGTAATVTPYDLGQTRQKIAFRLIWILSAVIAGYLLVSLSFSQACWVSSSCSVKDAYGMSAGSFNTVFSALLGIVGSVVGFYFGSQSKT